MGVNNTVLKTGAAVALVTLLLYAGALSCGFINLDDPFYITNNPLIRSLAPAALWRIFTESHLAAWLPVTYLSLAIDYHFWGDNPLGYHLTNILLHAGNAGLVVIVADRLWDGARLDSSPGADSLATFPAGPGRASGGGGSPGYLYYAMLLLAGLLWSVHPLRVESVAWAAERKDVLNGLFTLAAVLAYLDYARRRDAGTGQLCRPYLLSLVLFTLSLLAKQVSVTVPFILLMIDWFPLRRYRAVKVRSLLLEKAPFIGLSLAVTAVTVYFASNAIVSMKEMPFYVRVLVSGNAVFEYCRLTLFPVGISPYFVLPKPLPYGYLVNTGVVVAISLFLLWRARLDPAPAVTWFAFVVLLSPMLAFVHAGDDIALAARYTYLPSIPVAICAAAALRLRSGSLAATGNRARGALLLGCTVLFLLWCAVVTVRLIPVWKDTGSFWSRVIAIEPVGRAYGDRGVYYLINGRSAAAVADFTAAIEIAASAGVNTVHNLYAFRGVALSDGGRFAEAVADFDRAIAIYPHQTYFQYRGQALQALGRTAEAAEDLRRAGPKPPPIDWFEMQ